jgi:Flp pilus assembly protein TadD
MRSVVAALFAAGLAAFGSNITIDYPVDGSVFPPEITPPTFLWHDAEPSTVVWGIEIEFAKGKPIRTQSSGGRLKVGPIDPEAVAASNKPPEIAPALAESHTWVPDATTWDEIKKRSVQAPATITVTGYSDAARKHAVSKGQFRITTSSDPVGAPIFYRDVPLMPNLNDKGVIKPLPANAVKLIKWRLRFLNEPEGKVVMENPATCANCHSFSLDGKTLGLDVDGPQNDRGLYALIPVARQTAIRNQDVIQWPTVRDPKVERLRAAFMSQVSPDGRFVLTTIDDSEASKRTGGQTLEDKYYNANFLDYRFLQVFYPTRGVLAWYDRERKKLTPLPGASDPRYVQTDGVWSPDGKWVVFARAEAKSPYPPGAPQATYANDPNETQIRYELYRVPFNDGKGGTPEKIAGASGNGMSNNFPKVSPDGKWIVFVQCRNAQLMRPDSKLYIVPFAGGEARLMKCNTSLMNSWHTFSPNGRWMAFSSKSRSPYTQMYLTHIDDHGNDSPAILVDNSTAANRAVNLPEFVNIGPGGLEHIDAPATEFYRLFNASIELMQKGSYEEAVAVWRKALEINTDDSRAHFNLAHCLNQTGHLDEAIVEYRKAIELEPGNASLYANLGLALATQGKMDEALEAYRKSVELNPANAEVQADLGVALFQQGQGGDGLDHLRKAVELDSDNAEVCSKAGNVLAKIGRVDEGLPLLERAVAINPSSVEYQFNLAYVLGKSARFADAVPHMEKAVELSGGKDWRSLAMLGGAYYRAGRPADAVQVTRRALEVAEKEGNGEAARSLRSAIAQYGGGAQ